MPSASRVNVRTRSLMGLYFGRRNTVPGKSTKDPGAQEVRRYDPGAGEGPRLKARHPRLLGAGSNKGTDGRPLPAMALMGHPIRRPVLVPAPTLLSFVRQRQH